MITKKLFLLYPVLILVLSSSFLNTPQKEIWDRHISIKLVDTHIISNNGVGEDWDNYLMVKDQIIRKGETATIKLEKRAPLIVEAHSIEHDKNYSDLGTNTMIFTYSDIIAITESRFELGVKVMENGGRSAGNMAEWTFLFDINKAKQ